MRAVVLVGGFGTRLRPLTSHTPKQMLPVVDRPMIEWVVGALGRHGVDEAVLSLGYRPDAFMDAYPDGVCAGVRLVYAVEPEPLDTAGAIAFAASCAGISERFLAVNGDVLTDLDIGALLDFHTGHGGEATITLHRVDDPSRFGVVATDECGKVTAFVEKPAPGTAPSDLISAGTYVLEPSVLERVPAGVRCSIERQIFPALVEAGTLFAFPDGDVYWLDTGTPQQYLQAQLDVLAGERGSALAGVDAGAAVEAGATVQRSVVQGGATVVAGATVTESVLMAGVTVEARATVTSSVIGPGATIGEGATLHDVVVGAGVVVDGGAVLEGVRIPDPDADAGS